MRMLSILLLLAVVTQCSALQVKVYPAEPLSIMVANPNRGYTDLVLHNIVMLNESTQAVSLTAGAIEVLEGDRVILSRFISADEIQKASAGLNDDRKQGFAVELDRDFPWKKILGEKITLADGPNLGPQQAVLVQKIFLSVPGIPSAVRVRATAKDANGKQIETSTQLIVSRHQSTNKYHFPLQGVWFMRSVPNVTSHHRWHAQTEFAVDFWKLGENSLPWKTDASKPEDFYAFGAPVLATADGVVITAMGDRTQDYAIYAHRKDESDEQYGNRLEQHNLEQDKIDLHLGLGNYVVIQHDGGEYSYYCHLKTGSVKVKGGDHVTAGQQIAEVGDTGDTNLVHLHFQISDGPDPITARSVPFDLVDLRQTDVDLGRIVMPIKH